MTIYLDSTLLTTSKWFCTGITNLSFPSISYGVTQKGGYGGRKISPMQSRSYSFATEWILLGSDFSDLADQRDEFLGIISEILNNGKATLKITKHNNKTVQLEVKGFRVAGDIKAGDGSASTLMIEFESEYPFLVSDTEYITEINLFAGGGMAIPMAIPMDMSTGGSSHSVIANNGNYKAYPIVRFIGDLTNPTLQNLTTGETMSLTDTLANSGEYDEVDTFLRIVTDQAGANQRSLLTGFITLAKGDNSLKLSGTGTTGKAVIRYRDHYVNI